MVMQRRVARVLVWAAVVLSYAGAFATPWNTRPAWCPPACWIENHGFCHLREEDICHDYDDQAHPGTFRGVYELGFEASVFRPAGSECRYFLSGNVASIRDELAKRGPYARAFVELVVDGELSGTGCYGHMGAFSRRLEVTKVRSFTIDRLWLPPTAPATE
jgi:hypothetical protein